MNAHLQLVTEAADFAARAHQRQRRKDAEATPYINHLTHVAKLLAAAGCDVHVVAAGYLHDTIEDVGVSYEMIADSFGEPIAALVIAVTDDKSLPKAERKQQQVEHAPHLPADVAALKLADKISNLTSLRDAPPAGWPASRLREYVDWAHAVVSGLRDPNPTLWAHYLDIRADLLARLDGPAV